MEGGCRMRRMLSVLTVFLTLGSGGLATAGPKDDVSAATQAWGLSRSLLNLAEWRRQRIIPSVHCSAGDTDIAAPRERIDPEPIVASRFCRRCPRGLTRRAPGP